MFDKVYKNMIYYNTACGTVKLILTAIKRNGLEKTLEDLRQYSYEDEGATEEVYRSFLAILRDFGKKEKKL